jgi:hypothetical protein
MPIYRSSQTNEGLNQMNEMDGFEINAAGMGRRLLLGAGLLGATFIAAGAAKAEGAGGGFSAFHHEANDPLPPAAVSENRSMFPGFRQTFVRTRGVMVDGKLAEGAVINTLTGGKGFWCKLSGFPERSEIQRNTECNRPIKSLSGHIPRSSLRSSDLLPFYHQYPAACCGDFLFNIL